ncbi:carboxyl transferase domain-containing protein [Mycolicibacterium sp. CBMA 361]|uniref:acyl-CoA carboxylase subunit beta n=1 Tax=Mycolicibacterium sp. CBMA 361 TaxID=2606610 RepID=UPI0012DC575A|nr:carboxyl transferase domain-containing protein [Mycolicibacterium sp. CBMA 361]MUM34437.1 propionyl-CoA carboxylase [Mycolicibacterium sp. CBMA 361]
MSTLGGFNWPDALSEFAVRRARARQLGGERRVGRQKEQGRYTIRERIDAIADSFSEIGEFAVFEECDALGNRLGTLPASYVCGLARVDGRPVALGGEDFTVRAGAPQAYLDRMKGGMGGFVEDLAHEYKIPLLMFVEGIGGDVAAQEQKGHAYLTSTLSWTRSFELLNEVPVLTMISGAAVGASAARAVASHFSVMTKDSVIFAGGPPLVRRALGLDIDKHELGGGSVATASGTVDNLARDEDDAIAQMRTVLSYLPQNVWQLPERTLLDIIPENRRQAYRGTKVINAVVDEGSFFEIGSRWGKSLVTGLARIDGMPIGVFASNPQHLGGAIDAAAAEKQVRLMNLCNTFHLPVLYFVDVPGFMVGPDAERANVMRWGVRAIQSVVEATVPIITVQVRKAYGLAVSATSNPDRLGLRLAWPSGEWGDLPIEGGVEAAYRREIDAAEDPIAMRAEIEARMAAAVPQVRQTWTRR